MRIRLWLIWDHWTRIQVERAQTALAWKLPRWLVKWAVVRAAVEVEPNTNPAYVTAGDMVTRFQ